MIFFEHKSSTDENKIVKFSAKEDERILGECTLALKESYAEITQISYNEDSPFIIDGLIKAAFNFAANKNYYMGRCNIKEISLFLDRMNFVKCENGYENDIPSILMGNCSGCGK